MTRLLVCVATLVCIMDKAWCYGTWSFEQRLAARFGASAKFDITVVDDEGAVVPDAKVSVGFGQQGNKRLGEVVSIMTDEKGLSEAEGRTTGDNLWIKVEKEGYYSSKTNFNYIAVDSRHEVHLNRWQPYGERFLIVLRKKHLPIQGIAQKGYETYYFPRSNEWYAFDLAKRDLVAPYGSGEYSDLRIRIDTDGNPTWKNKRISMMVKFDGEGNGGYYVGNENQSDFAFPYAADISELFQETVIIMSRKKNSNGGWSHVMPLENKSMVARIRTRRDDDGNIVSCNYTNIRFLLMEADSEGNPIFTIDYRLNLTPNDPNLETL